MTDPAGEWISKTARAGRAGLRTVSPVRVKEISVRSRGSARTGLWDSLSGPFRRRKILLRRISSAVTINRQRKRQRRITKEAGGKRKAAL